MFEKVAGKRKNIYNGIVEEEPSTKPSPGNDATVFCCSTIISNSGERVYNVICVLIYY